MQRKNFGILILLIITTSVFYSVSSETPKKAIQVEGPAVIYMPGTFTMSYVDENSNGLFDYALINFTLDATLIQEEYVWMTFSDEQGAQVAYFYLPYDTIVGLHQYSLVLDSIELFDTYYTGNIEGTFKFYERTGYKIDEGVFSSYIDYFEFEKPKIYLDMALFSLDLYDSENNLTNPSCTECVDIIHLTLPVVKTEKGTLETLVEFEGNHTNTFLERSTPEVIPENDVGTFLLDIYFATDGIATLGGRLALALEIRFSFKNQTLFNELHFLDNMVFSYEANLFQQVVVSVLPISVVEIDKDSNGITDHITMTFDVKSAWAITITHFERLTFNTIYRTMVDVPYMPTSILSGNNTIVVEAPIQVLYNRTLIDPSFTIYFSYYYDVALLGISRSVGHDFGPYNLNSTVFDKPSTFVDSLEMFGGYNNESERDGFDYLDVRFNFTRDLPTTPVFIWFEIADNFDNRRIFDTYVNVDLPSGKFSYSLYLDGGVINKLDFTGDIYVYISVYGETENREIVSQFVLNLFLNSSEFKVDGVYIPPTPPVDPTPTPTPTPTTTTTTTTPTTTIDTSSTNKNETSTTPLAPEIPLPGFTFVTFTLGIFVCLVVLRKNQI